MCSQSKGIGSADISASTYDKIRTIPARLHCASHRRDNKLFYRFWITPRRGETLSVSTRHRPADLWALAGALTSHSGLHFLRFSDIFNGDSDKWLGKEDGSLAIFGDMIPWFPKNSQVGVSIILLWKIS
jgi:hypothetical protein